MGNGNVDGHRRECHKCQYDGKGDEICLRCPGPAVGSCKGVSYVWLDEQPDPDGLCEPSMREIRAAWKAADGVGASRLDYGLERELVRVLANMFSLEDVAFTVLRHKLMGHGNARTAEALGLSVSAVRKVLRTVLRRCPEVLQTLRRLKDAGKGSKKALQELSGAWLRA